MIVSHTLLLLVSLLLGITSIYSKSHYESASGKRVHLSRNVLDDFDTPRLRRALSTKNLENVGRRLEKKRFLEGQKIPKISEINKAMKKPHPQFNKLKTLDKMKFVDYPEYIFRSKNKNKKNKNNLKLEKKGNPKVNINEIVKEINNDASYKTVTEGPSSFGRKTTTPDPSLHNWYGPGPNYVYPMHHKSNSHNIRVFKNLRDFVKFKDSKKAKSKKKEMTLAEKKKAVRNRKVSLSFDPKKPHKGFKGFLQWKQQKFHPDSEGDFDQDLDEGGTVKKSSKGIRKDGGKSQGQGSYRDSGEEGEGGQDCSVTDCDMK